MELSGENLSMAENCTYYAHIDWLLINSMANVVQSNFLSHNAVVKISKKVNLGQKLHIRKKLSELKLIDCQKIIGQS